MLLRDIWDAIYVEIATQVSYEIMQQLEVSERAEKIVARFHYDIGDRLDWDWAWMNAQDCHEQSPWYPLNFILGHP